ncbi:dihydropyrimidine dehydrogenase (NADP(+)), chloroplastic [Tanacetum coccineum]
MKRLEGCNAWSEFKASALNDALTTEVQRLKLMAMKLNGDATNFSQLSISPQVFQLHHQQVQQSQQQNGYSSKAVHPIPLGKVMSIAQTMKNEFPNQDLSIFGIGGFETGSDAAEFILLGANIVQKGGVSWSSIEMLPVSDPPDLVMNQGSSTGGFFHRICLPLLTPKQRHGELITIFGAVKPSLDELLALWLSWICDALAVRQGDSSFFCSDFTRISLMGFDVQRVQRVLTCISGLNRAQHAGLSLQNSAFVWFSWCLASAIILTLRTRGLEPEACFRGLEAQRFSKQFY